MFSEYRQTQLVIWINQILFFAFSIFMFEWWMILVAFISTYIFGCMSEISLHRFFTHRSYETTSVKEKLLRIFAFLSAQGATLSWVTVHRTHHAYEDTDKDPHSPFHLKWWEIYLALLPNTYKKNLVVDLAKTHHWKYFVFENKYYFWMWVALWTFCLLVNFYLLYFLVAGAAMWYIATCVINIVSHRYYGTKKFDNEVAFNSGLINLFTGVGHHNNHHRFPRSYTYSVNGEIDVYAWVIRKFFIIETKK